ncbi:MAG TPA: hypothetical protein ENK02_12700 [Planctomycetes bacterium]|nr:hypothetical protein [Planctomycetota bacterium]
MRTLANKKQWVWQVLPVLLVGFLSLSSCRVAEPRGFFSDLSRTDAEVRAFPLDDILVWPVTSKDPKLAGVLDLMTRELHQGLLRAQYSVLSHKKAVELAQSLGTGQDSALEALRRLKGDGVLVVSVDSWNERGLESLGKVETQGRFVLLSPEGTVLWQGRFRNNGKLVDPYFESHLLEDLRLEAVKNLARKLSKKFPPHRVL